MNIVTLTTDFGTQDHYAALLKGALLSKKNDLQIVDVSHSVDTHDLVQGAFYMANTYESFPEGTIHIASIYSFYQPNYKMIAFKRDGHYFVGPDNGIFSLLFDDLVLSTIHEVDTTNLPSASLQEIIAHACACILHGLELEQIGPRLIEPNQKLGLRPVVTKHQIRATIIHVDHFENVIINLKRDQFEKMRAGRDFELYFRQHDPITRVSRSYGSVEIGDVLCTFNSADYMEISINMGKASSMLGLHKNETVQINFL